MVPLHDDLHAVFDSCQYRLWIAGEIDVANVECSPIHDRIFFEGVVGLTELESVTSCVSSRRSNQLSYKPLAEMRRLRNTGVRLESKWRPKLNAVNL